jgi:CheY-like chemotaxis protein
MAKILVIDDDRLFVQLIVKTLEKNGHEAVGASDGLEGMKLFEKSAFDCVVCDLIMPNQEGLETIKTLRRIAPNLAIVAISGGMPSGDIHNLDLLDVAKTFGANAALKKPFQLPELSKLVEDLLAPVMQAARIALR